MLPWEIKEQNTDLKMCKMCVSVIFLLNALENTKDNFCVCVISVLSQSNAAWADEKWLRWCKPIEGSGTGDLTSEERGAHQHLYSVV